MARKGKADVLIDIKGDQKNLDKAIAKSNSGLKGMAKDAKASGMALAKMAAVGVAALGTMTYAAWNVTKGFKDYGVELDKTNKITGIGADKISQIAYAAEQEHASIEDLQTGWRRLSKAMSDADEGLAESVRSFDNIGVSIHDATGQLKSLDVMTLEVADALKGMTNDTQKAALAQEIFGRSGMNLIPFFELGSDGIHDLMLESKSLGNVWTDEMAAGAKLFDDKLTALGYSFKAVKWQIGNALMPEFEKITDWFMTNKDWLIQSFKDIFDIEVTNVGDATVKNLDKIKKWVDNNKDLLKRMWEEPLKAAIGLYDTSVLIKKELQGFQKLLGENINVVSPSEKAAGEAFASKYIMPAHGTPPSGPSPWKKGDTFRGDVSRALTILKLDSNATNALLTGKAVSVTSQAATTGT